MLSIVIPVDVDANTYYHESIKPFLNRKDVEIIIVNQESGISRAERLNVGFHRSQGNVVLFHHPRSKLTQNGIEFLILESQKEKNKLFWGGFLHQFDTDHIILKWISWYSNVVRVRWKGIVYLDHCIFFSREIWKDDLSIQYLFEDTELSLRFLNISFPKLLPYVSYTSAHRYLKNGIMHQIFLNLILKIGFKLRLPTDFLFHFYQK
ncbi:hypothetical protein AB3N60_14155 [Leptospira sp. WS39.C2]